ncbi:unnamed protein product, partial [Phaeothamnion confervicola]
MCGFAGPEVGTESQVLERMNQTIHHRGPDDSGMFFSRSLEPESGGPAAALAMRRLAVIDLHAGHQPISNEDDSCWIVYNGEVYNYQEMRLELEAAGHKFKTDTDTEVLLHAYEEYGVDCLGRFRGMFALAIWDEPRRRLLLARDHVGIKPLFYTTVDSTLVFGSEIKALLAYPGVPRKLNQEATSHFLTYLYAPAPATMFEGIHQLKPGHRLILQDGRQTVEEYWKGPSAWVEQAPAANLKDVSPEALWEVLSESVDSHLVSDVPVGAFLSGGIDSSAIVALMAKHMNRKVKTFSIGFEGSGLYDESKFAQLMGDSVGSEHNVLHIDAASVERLPQILRHIDEPMADASVIPNYFLAEMARKQVTVVLSGIGGDELFGGY